MATEAVAKPRGVIVIDGGLGRALRKGPAAIPRSEVVDCSGEFVAGDRIYVSMRARDGAQYAIATGSAGLDANALRSEGIDGDREVVSAASLVLLWRHAGPAAPQASDGD